MPVHFACKQCHQLLSVTRRKIGSEVVCPKCGRSSTVPDEETAAAGVAMIRSAAADTATHVAPELIVYDDVDELIAAPRSSTSINGSIHSAAMSTSSTSAGRTTVASRSGSASTPQGGMLLLSRRAVYVQGLLFCLIALVGFGLGYLIGRSHGPTAAMDAEAKGGPGVSLAYRGNFLFSPSEGLFEPDSEAVAIALPEGKRPERKLSAQGLRPQDAYGAGDAAVKAINALGGDYAKADARGMFEFVVPRPGRYYLLLISRHAKRPRSQAIDRADLQQMNEYFQVVSDLISQNKYHWSVQDLTATTPPLTQQFGVDGE